MLVAALVGCGGWACSLLIDGDGYVGGALLADAANDANDATSDAGPAADADASDACTSCPEVPPNDLLLWLSADVGVELATDGEHVAVWRDRTPSVRPGRAELAVKQPVASAQPKRVTSANGLPAIEFD